MKLIKNIFVLLLITTSIFMLGSSSVEASQTQLSLSMEYNENCNIYILKTGDTIYHWDITDQGTTIQFPISLGVPNSTTGAIVDASIILTVIQSSPKDQAMGQLSAQYGGYMETDLPDDEWEYSFSHLRLETVLYFDNLANVSLGTSWRDSIVTQLETTLGVDFLQYNSYYTGYYNSWTSEFRAYPKPTIEADIWNSILDNVPCGQTLLSPKERFIKSENKAIQIAALWDDINNGGTTGGEERWEYVVNIELFEDGTISIEDNASNKVLFHELLDYEGEFIMPSWVNSSYLDIYTYKGSEITKVYPAPEFDGQERCHIGREMDRGGEMLGTLSNAAFFNFTDTKQSEPILLCELTTDDTTVSEGEEINIIGKIINVGKETAYNIDVSQTYPYSLISDDNFNLTSGELITQIPSLAPEETTTLTATLTCNHNITRNREYQFNVVYDATADPSLGNHWSRPQRDGTRFTGSSNRIRIFQNGDTAEPWLIVSYNISNYETQVGDSITASATITNIGDVDATNIRWDFDSIDNYIYSCDLGINSTNYSGVIDRLDSGETTKVSADYIVDAYNRFYGGICELSCDMIFDADGGRTNIAIDSVNTNVNDAGSVRYIIYPKEDQKFGPIINVEIEIDAPTSQSGDIITAEFIITNVGTTTAYNVIASNSYRDGDEVFYIDYHSGINVYPSVNLGDLQPGENVYYNARFKLLKNTTADALSLTPYVQFRSKADGSTYYSTPNLYHLDSSQKTEKSNNDGIDPLILIALLGAVGLAAAIGYYSFFYKK